MLVAGYFAVPARGDRPMNPLADALRALEPYLDAIVCYASSMDEHEPNRLAFNARQALAALTDPALAEPFT